MMTDQAVYDDFRENIRPLVVEQFGEGDVIAIYESFNDWTDALCKDGQITTEQYNRLDWEE